MVKGHYLKDQMTSQKTLIVQIKIQFYQRYSVAVTRLNK